MTANPVYNFIKKPFLALMAVLLVASIIIYIQQQKAGVMQDIANFSIGKEKGSKYQRAPDFAGIQKWINSEPLKMEQLRGKVVLVDFWTYTCINCIRTLPFLKSWHEKYADAGLVIVGVHTPEFNFERDAANVRQAMADQGIEYAVVQDNDYLTWRAWDNHYWPHKFLVDKDGIVRYEHIGEGGHEEHEQG